MFRYLLALIVGTLLFAWFYFQKTGETNLLLRSFGMLSFAYFSCALAVTPVISIMKQNNFTPYRRVFGVLAFLVALAHAGVYFYMEYTYQQTFFILAHFKEWDVLSGTIAFLVMAVLAIISNDFSVRLLKGTWKKIQLFAYPLFLLAALHVAFASRFDGFYMVIIGTLILLRTSAYLGEKKTMDGIVPASLATKYFCVPCGYIYDEIYGDPDGGIPPGTRFEDIPDDWICPVCGVSKSDFIAYAAAADEKIDITAAVLAVSLLNPTTLELVLSSDHMPAINPGQYARIALADRDGIFYRSYSIVDADDGIYTFCIKLSTGRGGNVLRTLKPGDILWIDGIYGNFTMKDTSHPKIFIATGTGLAPMMHMMRAIPHIEKLLLFWVQDTANLFYMESLANIPGLTTHTFLSREAVDGFRYGRIDLSAFRFPEESEFYICGNGTMVEESLVKLRAFGFQNIYYEKF